MVLTFKKIEYEDLEVIKHYMRRQTFGTCDYTIFGIYLWAEHYQYAYCVYEDTFFLRGIIEDGRCDFAVPVGKMNTKDAIKLIREYCRDNQLTPRFYFVPETALHHFEGANITKMDGWWDYIYSAEEMIEMKGRKFNKKRNRFNKFVRGCTSCRFEPLTPDNIESAKEFFEVYLAEYSKPDPRFASEALLIRKALDLFFELGQSGGLLIVNDRVVAMTIGEVIGDTLYVHVEKALREYEGAYEAINNYYAQHVLESEEGKGVSFINREEDMGDEGIRQAKMAYNPVKLLNKYEISFE